RANPRANTILTEDRANLLPSSSDVAAFATSGRNIPCRICVAELFPLLWSEGASARGACRPWRRAPRTRPRGGCDDGIDEPFFQLACLVIVASPDKPYGV